MLRRSLIKKAPWSGIEEFAMSEQYCALSLYPRQLTLLKLIYLEVDNFTAYDLMVIEEWREGFTRHRNVFGVQPDIWQRIDYLKHRGYRRFPHIQAILGRRASKGFLGAILATEQIAYLIALDNPQHHYSIREGKDCFLNVGATSQTQAQRHQFADIRDVVEGCGYLQPWIAETKDHQMRLRTPADLRRIATMKAAGVDIEHNIASLWVVALSASSVSGRGATSYCLDPETPVLTADLRWVPIKSVMPGDAVVGLDEMPPRAKNSTRNGQRKLRRATVLAKAKTVKDAYRLTFDDGRTVVCSGDHRWLLRRSSGPLDWRVTRGPTDFHSLKVGDQIVQVVQPWEEDRSWEAGYLAGVFDGEGSLNRGGKRGDGASGLSVFFAQNPGDVLDQTLALLKEKGFSPQPSNSPSYTHDGKCEQWAIRGVAESLRFLGQIRPSRLTARAAKAFDGVSLRGKGSTRYQQPSSVATIVAIEPIGKQELIDIQTTTGTFIANGFVSHNCNMFDEFAFHVQGTDSTKSSENIYEDWQPSLGQFKKDALTYVPSSPFTKTGKFFELYQLGKILMSSYDDAQGHGAHAAAQVASMRAAADLDEVQLQADPTKLIFQGASWDLYRDWERGPELVYINFDAAPEDDLRSEEQQRRKIHNPEKFMVEREGQFAEVIGAYLDRDKVDAMFGPVPWREPSELVPTPFGRFDMTYRIHVDPSKSGANFALAVAHTEIAPPDEFGERWPHVIMDRLHVWKAADFPINEETGKREIDYLQVERELDELLYTFPSTTKFSADQFNTVGLLQRLRKKYSPGIRVVEDFATEKNNWERAEKFKSALTLGWVHSFPDELGERGGSLLEQECKFLAERNGKVIKQESGPVTTKDLYDAVSTVVVDLLHESLERWGSGDPTGSSYGHTDPSLIRSVAGIPGAANLYASGTRGSGKGWERLNDYQGEKTRRARIDRGGYQPGATRRIRPR